MLKKKERPKSILLSKRANVFYLEHVRVFKKDDRVIFATDVGSETSDYFNLPERNTIFILLGKGSSITDAAVRRLTESGVMIGFCGSGGSPLFAATDFCFLTPQSEYRPTEYMQKWVKMWFVEEERINVAKRLLYSRLELCKKSWDKLSFLKDKQAKPGAALLVTMRKRFQEENSNTGLLLAEAYWAKCIYKYLADVYKLEAFSRFAGGGGRSSKEYLINQFIDHGNYIAYGFASVVLYGLGISFAFPVLHGKTRRGGLVFDIADLFKDALVLPLAFEFGSSGASEQEFRDELINKAMEFEVLDLMFDFIKSVL
jgi:CRISP-associated protein Cas1